MGVRFVVFGDTKGKNNGINKGVLEKIIQRIKKLDKKPDFFALLGDTVAGSADPDIHKKQLKGFKGVIDAGFPRVVKLPVVGNHEVNNEPVDDSFEKLVGENYIDFKQHGRLEGYNNTAYYMDLENCRFIILNCYHNGRLKKIEKEQLSWFENVSSVDKKFKIVFVHCPPFPTGAHLGTCLDQFPGERDKLWSVIEKNKVDIVFSGHEHNYSRRVIDKSNRKIYQIITGGGGEKLRSSFKCKKGVIVPPKALFHFVVADMEPNSIVIKAISIDGKVIDEFKIEK